MSPRFVTPLLLLAATLCLCQNQTELDWPQDAESASPRPGQYNYTYEILLDTIPYGPYEPFELSYTFNITLGTPPQTVPVMVDIATSEVSISNLTTSVDENMNLKELEFYKYNPNLSSSSNKDYQTIILSNSSVQKPLEGLSYAISETHVYTSDNYSIGGLAFASPLSFLSFSQGQFPSQISEDNTTETRSINYTSLWHTVGFGLREASITSYDKIKNNDNTITQATAYGGIIDDFRYGLGIIRSRSYSLWLNAPEDHSSHLLLGGLDSKAYIAPLITLPTSLYTDGVGLWKLPRLTVDTSFTSITLSGQNSSFNLSLPVGTTTLTTYPNSHLSLSVTKSIWEALGADYEAGYYPDGYPELIRLAAAVPIVPCSYLTNSSTLDFQFTGSNITVSVPMSDITIGTSRPDGGYESCRLTIRPSSTEYSLLGADLLKKVYQVYDLDNKVISVALTNFTSTERNIVPIPEKGGVTAMNSSAIGSSDSVSGSPRALGSFENVWVFGLSAVVILLGVSVF